MKRLLQINPVLRVSTSTGRIMQEIGEYVMQNGCINLMEKSPLIKFIAATGVAIRDTKKYVAKFIVISVIHYL